MSGDASHEDSNALESSIPLEDLLDPNGRYAVILKEDLARLEAAGQAASDDIRAMCILLGLGDHARPYSPREVLVREIWPRLKQLIGIETEVKSAEVSIRRRVDELGRQEVELPDGTRAGLVGRKLPKEFLR